MLHRNKHGRKAGDLVEAPRAVEGASSAPTERPAMIGTRRGDFGRPCRASLIDGLRPDWAMRRRFGGGSASSRRPYALSDSLDPGGFCPGSRLSSIGNLLEPGERRLGARRHDHGHIKRHRSQRPRQRDGDARRRALPGRSRTMAKRMGGAHDELIRFRKVSGCGFYRGGRGAGPPQAKPGARTIRGSRRSSSSARVCLQSRCAPENPASNLSIFPRRRLCCRRLLDFSGQKVLRALGKLRAACGMPPLEK